jgi:hypothetical protein
VGGGVRGGIWEWSRGRRRTLAQITTIIINIIINNNNIQC